MKILIVDNMFSNLTTHLDAAGGFERRNLTDAYLLAEAGHEVYYTYCGDRVDDSDFPFKPVFMVKHLAENDLIGAAKWRGLVKKRMIAFLSSVDVDVVLFGSNTMMALASEILKSKPLVVHVASFLTGNGFIDSGRMSQFYKLSKSGAYFVFNTNTTAHRFMDQAKDQAAKLIKNPTFEQHVRVFKAYLRMQSIADHVNSNNMGVGLVGRKDEVILSDKGYAVIACRADPAKMAHRFAKVEFPLKVFFKSRAVSHKKDFLNTTMLAFEKNPNIKVYLDRPYEEIMMAFRKARCCIVSWPDETFGLTAFEAASFGVPSIVMKRDKKDLNATVEFLSQVGGSVKVVHYGAGWNKSLTAAFNDLGESASKDERIELATAFAKRYSKDAYIKEKVRCLKAAVSKHQEVHS